MKKIYFITIMLLLNSSYLFSQVAINTDGSTPDKSAMLDVKSTARGLLIPRISTLARNQIPSPATGLLIYNTDANFLSYYDGGQWITLCAVSTGVAGAGGSQPIIGVANKTDNSSPHHSAMLDVFASDKGVLTQLATNPI